MWSGGFFGGSDYWAPGTNGGSWDSGFACGTGHCVSRYAFSVRCVKDLFMMQALYIVSTCRCLQLCDWAKDNSCASIRCADRVGECAGAVANACYPPSMWSASKSDTGQYVRTFLQFGQSKAGDTFPVTYAFSVRCYNMDLLH